MDQLEGTLKERVTYDYQINGVKACVDSNGWLTSVQLQIAKNTNGASWSDFINLWEFGTATTKCKTLDVTPDDMISGLKMWYTETKGVFGIQLSTRNGKDLTAGS